MTKLANTKLLQFEGLRGFAALIVFFSHIRNTFFINYEKGYIQYTNEIVHNKYITLIIYYFTKFFFNGHVAVDIFWIMSGYVLTMRFFSMEPSKLITQVQNSVSKRYIRLLIPVAVSIIIGFILMRLDLLYNDELVQSDNRFNQIWLKSQFNYPAEIMTALKTIFWNTFFDYKDMYSFNSSLWTMCPEFFGSLFCFASVVVTYKNKNRFLFYFVCILVAILFLNRWLLSFCLGVLLSDYNHSNHHENSFLYKFKKIESYWFRSNLFPVSLFFITIIMIGIGDVLQLAYIFESFIIVYLNLNSSALVSFFASRPLVFLGKISFSLYLIHISVICSLTCYLYLELNMLTDSLRIWVSMLVSLLFLLVISYIYTITIDTFALTFSNKIGKIFTAETTT